MELEANMQFALRALGGACSQKFHQTRRIAGRMLFAIGIATSTCCPAWADDASDESFLSRITILAPVYTRHLPHDRGFNEHNWGGFAEIRLVDDISLIGGEFINSYSRETVLAGVTFLPFHLEASHVRVDLGGEIGADLNGGYKGFNKWDPLFGTLAVRFSGTGFQDQPLLNHLGLAVSIIPPLDGPVTAINLAVTLRL
jgi:hypothetical protein